MNFIPYMWPIIPDVKGTVASHNEPITIEKIATDVGEIGSKINKIDWLSKINKIEWSNKISNIKWSTIINRIEWSTKILINEQKLSISNNGYW